MYPESELLPLSALQHLAFCARQCALIHVEGLWGENLLTAQGRVLHERVDLGGGEVRRGVRVEFGLALRSLRLGLAGKADCVEFRAGAGAGPPVPCPVEYKRGKPKEHDADLVQLCAQALCLEEMLGCAVPEGALFYAKPRRRSVVRFDAALRGRVEELAAALHALVAAGETPPPEFGKKCRACSLAQVCLPRTCGGRTGRAAAYVAGLLEEM